MHRHLVIAFFSAMEVADGKGKTGETRIAPVQDDPREHGHHERHDDRLEHVACPIPIALYDVPVDHEDVFQLRL